MRDVLASYDRPVHGDQGRYLARAVGEWADDGMWEGWIEFESLDTPAPVIVGPIETRQSASHDLVYWAAGLTPVFLEGALQRALHPPPARRPCPDESPPRSRAARPSVTTEHTRPTAVLNPFEIGERSLDLLRQQLGALHRPRLLNIIAAYDLNPAGEDLSWMTDRQLITFVVTATDVQLASRIR